MSAVFTHGRLRLYLLKLLEEGPRHGYELIRLLENRFLGRYAPSAGTIYPRLARMETEGLVTHTAAGGRKVYEITDAGRAELRERAAEVAALESDIRASVEDLAGPATESETEVRGSARDPKRELHEAARQARRGDQAPPRPAPPYAPANTADELDERITAFAVEVRGLVRGARLTETQALAVVRALDTALAALRRVLR
ncbi:PadR family transcriptional regulator [Actinomycetes bacterium KLBMP 9797]